MLGLDWMQIIGLVSFTGIVFYAGRRSVSKKPKDVQEAVDVISRSGCRASRWLTPAKDKILLVLDNEQKQDSKK